MTPRLRVFASLCAAATILWSPSRAQEPVPEKLIVPTPARSFYGATINDVGGVFALDPVTNDLVYHDGVVSTSTANIVMTNFTPVGTGLLNGHLPGIPLRAVLAGDACTVAARVFISSNVPHLLRVTPSGSMTAISSLANPVLSEGSDLSSSVWAEVRLPASEARMRRGSDFLDYILSYYATGIPGKVRYERVEGLLVTPQAYGSNAQVEAQMPGGPDTSGAPGRSNYVFTLPVSYPGAHALRITGASTDATGPFAQSIYSAFVVDPDAPPGPGSFEGPAVAGDVDMTLFNLGSGSSTTRQVGQFLELYPLNPGVNIAVALDRNGTPRQMLILTSDAFDLREGPPSSGCSGPSNGDYNSSGGIDNADYLQWCSMVPVSALNKPTTVGNAAADLNGNGLTDLYDLSQMMRCQANALGPRGGATADPNFRNPSVGFIVTSEFAPVPDVPGFNVDFFIACRGNGRGVGSVLVQCDPAGAGTAKAVALTFDQNGFSNVLERGQNLGDGIINVFVDNALSLDRGASEINRNGQMAFTVAFNGGNNGIYRLTGVPVPEPVARVEADDWMMME